jgi:hypothetical protein
MKIYWGKRILSAAVVAVLAVCMVASAYMSNPAQKINSLTTEDYLEDYDYMCSVIEEEYPYLAYFEAQGMDYKAAMAETRKQVEDVSSLQEFYDCVQMMLQGKFYGVAHLSLFDPFTFQETSDHIQGLMEQEEYRPSVEHSPLMEMLTDPQTVAAYRQLQGKQIIQDQLEQVSPEKPDYRYDDVHHAVIIKIPSFGVYRTDLDEDFIDSVMKEYQGKEVEHIVFDITGNTGGSTYVWMSGIIPQFGGSWEYKERIYTRVGNHIERHMGDMTGIEPIPSDMEVPEFVHQYGFTHYCDYKMQWDYGEQPYDNAKRWLLVDERCYSAADHFAVVCKESGWATVVGRKTAGDGTGSSPVEVQLPNTGLIMRFGCSTADNGLGEPNAIYGTVPDILAKQGESPWQAWCRTVEFQEKK